MQGRQTHERREVLAAQGPSLGPIEHERPRTPGADTRHTAQEVLPLPPDGAGPQSRIEGIVTRHEAGIEPRAMGLDIRVETARRTPKAVLLRRPHGDAWPPSGQERTPFLCLRVGNRAGRGAHRLREVREGTRIQGLGLGQRAGGLGAIAGLPWVDHDDRPRRSRQRGHHGALEPSGRFEHQQSRADPLSLRHEVGNAGLLVGDRPACAGRAQGNIQMGFGHINTDTSLGRHPTKTPHWPRLAGCGLPCSRHLCGLWESRP